MFADVRVRRAVIDLFDFPWVDRNLYHGLYQRTAGFFDGSPLFGRRNPGRRGGAPSAGRGNAAQRCAGRHLSPRGSRWFGQGPEKLRSALGLLAEAGWVLRNGRLVNAAGEPLAFEIMVTTREQERLCLAFASQMARAGIEARVRMVDPVQFEARRAAMISTCCP